VQGLPPKWLALPDFIQISASRLLRHVGSFPPKRAATPGFHTRCTPFALVMFRSCFRPGTYLGLLRLATSSLSRSVRILPDFQLPGLAAPKSCLTKLAGVFLDLAFRHFIHFSMSNE